eukprot:TRINITY_DN20660_c0_g1_i1.p1 TRINITY_DN20660_c0_g1~~TRINITY_DN20660_c0_g1_i1.p1  ORF type:complete len:588 (+),score=175.76 TRINITY_DN20660_c0_g1_i1:146-1765(+)
MDPLSLIADVTGVEVKLSGTTARLLVAIILGYPYALLILRFISRLSLPAQHAIHGAVGSLLIVWVFGLEAAIHPLGQILMCYAILKAMPGTLRSVQIIFTLSMGHLFYVYYAFATSEILGDIDADVSAPMCIVMCKMVSIAFDLYDGVREKRHHADEIPSTPARISLQDSTSDVLSTEGDAEGEEVVDSAPVGTVKVAPPLHATECKGVRRRIEKLPGPLAFLAWAVFPIGAVVGPYMAFAQYRAYTDGSLFAQDDSFGVAPKAGAPKLAPPERTMAVVRVLAWCAAHALAFHIGSSFFPDSYWNDPAFYELPFFSRLFVVCATYRIRLYKYVLVWFLVEGSAIVCGIGLKGWAVGPQDRLVPDWDAYSNTRPLDLLFCYNFKIIVEVWHCKANDFLKIYVFKRLMFLKNKHISLAVSMVWLAAWHGLYAGYYVTFATEMVLIVCEAAIKQRLDQYLGKERPYALEVAGRVFFFFVTLAAWTFALIPFCLITWERTWIVWHSLYYYGFIACFLIIALDKVLPRPRRPRPPKADDSKKDK